MLINSLVSPKAVAFYVLGFFIYLNFKIYLFKIFVIYSKKLMNTGKKLVTKPKIISEGEMRATYENSIFKRVSQIGYSDEMVKMMYSMSGKNKETSKPLPPRKDCPFLKKIDMDNSEATPKFEIKIKM